MGARTHDQDAAAFDAYCLSCGYNLRGLAGDPKRCPECAHLNRVADLEVPAKLIHKALRRLETGAAMCGASVATTLLWLLPLLVVAYNPRVTNPPDYVWGFLVTLGIMAFVAFFFGAFHFRRSCRGNPRWGGTLTRFCFLSIVIAVAGLGAVIAGLSIVVAIWRGWNSLQVFGGLAICVASLAVATWCYRVARRAIHPLQRETAARFAREHFRELSR